MKKRKEKILSKKLGLVWLLAVALSLSLVSVAFAQGTNQKVFMADLNPLNHSGAQGHAVLLKDGQELKTKINSHGLAPNLPHAQHIHGMAQAISECRPWLPIKTATGWSTQRKGCPPTDPSRCL